MSTLSFMRAMVVDAAGSNFRLANLPRPVAGPGQLLVKIAASGVNPLDAKIRLGQAAHARQPLPAVLGMDLAGEVVTVGEGVSRFMPGDQVFGMATGVGGLQGSLAEFAVVNADFMALKSEQLSWREAAALPLVFITAWEGLVDRAKLSHGQTALIHGGAGGVGHLAIQIAKLLGARVMATGSARQREQIESLGATFIDYQASSVEDYVAAHTNGEGFDVIYDTVGGATLDASFKAARPYGGHVVSCLGWGSHSLAPLSFRAATYSGVFTLLPMLTGNGRAHHGEILGHASRYADAGQLRVLLDSRRFTLNEVQVAHQLLEQRQAQGKLVIDIE